MSDLLIHELRKTYDKGKVVAVDNVSFSVGKGEIFGLIGPDGAGKTSIIRVLTTLLLPDSGSVTVLGHDVHNGFTQIRSKLGYMPGRFSLYQDLSVEENLEFFATVFNTSVEGNYELIRDIYVQLEPFRKRRAGHLSGGMKQKLALCCALVHKPEILFLDEPTTGIDAVTRKEFWEMLRKLKTRGITMLVSTPYMDEANLCDRIALIQEGKILSIDTPANIVANYPVEVFAVRSDNIKTLLMTLRNTKAVESCFPFGEFLHVTFRKEASKEDLKKELENAGHENVIIKPTEPGIEDCFIRLMRKEYE